MRHLRLAFVAALLPLLAFAETPRDPVQALAGSYAKQAVEHAGSPRAIPPMIRLQQLSNELEDLNIAAQAFANVLARPNVDPHSRTVAQLLLLNAERARGRLQKAAELSRELGFVTDAYVLGSFENEGKGGCDTDFGVEGATIDLDAKFPIRGREVGWVKLAAKSQDGFVDLGEVLRPNTEAVAYALTALESPRDQKVTLSLGTSGAHRLWVNGEKVSASDRYNAPRPEQARVAVNLKRGTNRLLLKVCQENGALGYFLRQENGNAKVSLANVAAPMPKGTRGESVATITDWFAKQVERNPNDAGLRIDYATVLEFFRAYDEREHAVAVQAQHAARLAPNDAMTQLYASELDREDHNRQRKLLEAANKADPKSPLVRLALAGLELQREHPERALSLLQPLVKEHPGFAAARLSLARTHQMLGDWTRWSNEIEQLFRDAPQVPSVVREAAYSARRLERPQEELTRLRVALALRFDDEGTRRMTQQLLADLARVDEAIREAELRVKLDPFDLHARLELGELYASNGKLDEGRRTFRDAAALAPDVPEVYEREGRALLRAGHRDEAIASFDRALYLRPQNPALKEAVRTLKGEDGSFGDKYLIDALALTKDADAHFEEDAVMLADYTYVRVQPSGLSSEYRQVAVKVFTARGADSWRNYPISFSPARQEVRILRARVTKPDGSVITSFGDGERNLNEPWSGMYYDTRARVISFPSLAPGDVLELVYRLEDTAQENLLSDYWGAVDYIQNTTPKLRYQFFVDMPKERPLYWNQAQLPGVKHEQVPHSEGRVLYQWSASDVSRVVPEPGMPGWAEVAATLHVSTYKTWEQVGRYYWGLIRDQLTPNGEIEKATEEALKGVDRKDPSSVVSAIYGFVVKNTRYVALEFGIHGFKPYRVDRVLARRFGDCKDKASLIYSMLKVAGVDSRIVLLRMRHLGQLAPEPASLAAFNHAIVYVPSLELYLDGTAEYHGARELPSADRVANVLIVEPNGKSVFLTTPEAKATDNAETLEMEVALHADGSAEVKGRTGVFGSLAPQYRKGYESSSTRRSKVEQSWGGVFPGVRVTNVSINDTTRLEENVKLDYEMRVPRYAEVLPNALRFSPFGTGRNYTQTFASLAERKFDLVMSGPWSSTQTFRYPLPEGWIASDLPAAVSESSPFGSLKLEYAVEDGVLVAKSSFALERARVTANEYPAFRAFLNKVDHAFNRKLQLTKVGGKTAGR